MPVPPFRLSRCTPSVHLGKGYMETGRGINSGRSGEPLLERDKGHCTRVHQFCRDGAINQGLDVTRSTIPSGGGVLLGSMYSCTMQTAKHALCWVTRACTYTLTVVYTMYCSRCNNIYRPLGWKVGFVSSPILEDLHHAPTAILSPRRCFRS